MTKLNRSGHDHPREHDHPCQHTLPVGRRKRQNLSRMTSALRTTALTTALLGWGSQTAWAADSPKAEAAKDEEILDPTLSLDPTAPGAGALPGGMTPSLGEVGTQGDWRFGFHGQFTMPAVFGIQSRSDRQEGESKNVLHAPPQIPGDKETFSWTNAIPTPFAQLNLSYGNGVVTGVVTIVAEQAAVSQGFFSPSNQFGINDVFLDINYPLSDKVDLKVYAGAFSNRYGAPGEYDEGRYATPIIARTNGAGEAIVSTMRVHKNWTLLVEQGFQATSNRAPADLTPEAWNDFADPNEGASFVTDIHGGIAFRNNATLGVHYLHAWSQDDQATGRLAPDGKIDTLGADLRLNMNRFGHLYLAGARSQLRNVGTVGRIMDILNTDGGSGLIDNYLGDASNGNGELLVFGGQYDLSIGKLVSYPVPFSGDGPDLFVSLFTLGAKVDSEDPDEDGKFMWKRGIEATYSLLSWFAASMRFDQVDPDMSNTRESTMLISPRFIFRSNWQARDQIMLQYTRLVSGSEAPVRTGVPPREDPDAFPDEHVVSLSASMSW